MFRRYSIFAGLMAVVAGCTDPKPAPRQTQAAPPTAQNVSIPANDPPVTPADRDIALQRLNLAINAHGGADKLAKMQTMIIRTVGVFAKTDADDELQFRFPDYLRFTANHQSEKGKELIQLGIRPSGAWRSVGGQTLDIEDADQLASFRNELYLFWVTTLTPLKSDKFILRPLPPDNFGLGPAFGIRVDSKDRPTAALYFDEKSKFLIRIIVPTWSEAGTTHRRDLEYYNHERTEGIMLPTVWMDRRGGQEYGVWKQVTYRFPDKIPDGVFEKP